MGAWRRCVALAALLIVSVVSAAAETLSERGAYLANGILACANCHTPRDANGPIASKALSGGRVFDTPAFKVFSSNITPDRETGLGSWSDAELKKFMITGERPSGVQVAPIMPTAYYKALTPRDLDALIVYLRSVAPIRNEVPGADYKKPFGHEDAPFADRRLTEADMSDPVKRGMYLVTLGHCLECHTPDAGGKHKGGRTFAGPWGESRSSDITSNKTAGLGGWSDEEIKRAITQGISRDGRKLKPPMAFAAYAGLSVLDQDAIVAFLRTLPPSE
jgi:mono/diheme cytochrome c family protein